MQTLTDKAKEGLTGNQKAIGRLMNLFNKSSFTISRWIEAKDVRLTLSAAYQIVLEETGLGNEEILEDAEIVRA